MACNSCKKEKIDIIKAITSGDKEEKKNLVKNIKNYTIKSIIFIILLPLLAPLVMIGYVYALFKLIILSQGVDVLPLVKYVGEKIFKDDDDDEDDDDEEYDDDDEDYDNLDEEEYELENPNDIVILKD